MPAVPDFVVRRHHSAIVNGDAPERPSIPGFQSGVARHGQGDAGGYFAPLEMRGDPAATAVEVGLILGRREWERLAPGAAWIGTAAVVAIAGLVAHYEIGSISRATNTDDPRLLCCAARNDPLPIRPWRALLFDLGGGRPGTPR
jgi:hypothetical protein